MKRFLKTILAVLALLMPLSVRADVFNIPPPFLLPVVAPVAGASVVLLVDTGVALLVNTGVKLLVQ